MKKLFLFTLSVCVLAGCSLFQKQNAAADMCKINKKDCWEIAQLLPKTKDVPAHPETASEELWWNIPGGTKYENADLAKVGLTVTHYIMYRDGGSTVYVLNDEVSFSTNRRLGENPDYGVTTVRFKDGRTFKYDADGNLMK
jgi:hypothetical protein